MALIESVAASIVFFFFFISRAISDENKQAEINKWCATTPYPQPCEYFLTHNPKYSGKPINQKSDFYKLSLEVALDRATRAHQNTYGLGSKCRNKREKAAWSDCLRLYDETIYHLNRTADPSVKCSGSDAQMWLSTSLTYLETCKSGFQEFGITDYIYPSMSNNVTELISNILQVNEDNSKGPPEYETEGGFPTWVSPSDRKLLQSRAPAADAVVAPDGSGNFRTIKDAIAAASKQGGGKRFVIHVKAGTYKENVEIERKVKNVMLIGDGIDKTIITGSRSVGGGTTTFNSATFAVVGDGFIGRGITFRNTAGPQNHQAVALRSGSDLSVFYQCQFEGYQDTLYVHSQRQFYRECNIYGTVDFIFGNAAAVLQNCNIFARDPPNKTNTLTAQGRTDPNQNTGISIHNCRVTAAPDLAPKQSSVRTYLGRPWQKYSRTVYMKTNLDSLIDPAGWLPWSGSFALDTLYYGEFMNTGPGSSTAKRVGWKGYHVITSPAEASKFTVGSFISGNSWLPGTNVPFTSGL